MRISPAFAPRIAAYHALSRTAGHEALRFDWGLLADLAGRVFDAGHEAVDFDWVERGVELHARFADRDFRRVSRYVIFTLDESDELEFSDANHVLRGRGRRSGDGALWFEDVVPVTGADESGAVYSLTARGFERQRYATRGMGTDLLSAVHYVERAASGRRQSLQLCA
jgi:hypothetical protein